ncbi:hypothetical protein BC936DRAFT_143939 [Jimgerdemannia flammicorona]|uniref:DRBM domain-containing protein n=1 Tax=Jimgerdemannia flammicorona TaxID=994334 RepID=A0A432ZYA5_9FUNG|nr:hypothetical protein BC936DRAFT_143939 [Jimgerdemannia flammicorona]
MPPPPLPPPPPPPPLTPLPFEYQISLASFKDLLPTSNYKGLLLTLCQRSKRYGASDPEYTSFQEGQHHAPQFVALCKVGSYVGRGNGQKKIEAEQAAARDALEKMCAYDHGLGGDEADGVMGMRVAKDQIHFPVTTSFSLCEADVFLLSWSSSKILASHPYT